MREQGQRIIGKRYVLLDPLGRGGMGCVYRAHDRLTGELVALKIVEGLTSRSESLRRISTEDLSQHSRSSSYTREVSYSALLQEFRALSQLSHPNIVRVFDYGVEPAGQPFLVMELLRQAQSLLISGQRLLRPEKMYLLAQVLRALAYLHRRHLLHLDLKPSNLLLTLRGAEPQVKMVDFGLSLADAEWTLSDEGLSERRRPTAAGTRGYIAPEVLAGEMPSPASDLYAFGVVATELICGHRPFLIEGASWAAEPDLSPLASDDPLRNVLCGLLQPEPGQRLSSAADVLRLLNQAEDQQWALETVITQDSTLRSAPLCGRERELGQLEAALQRALGGEGHTVLICGESGIGKSRLIDELRYRALGMGLPVLRGQAQSVGGSALHLWQAPLRALCLQLAPDEYELAALAMVIPGIYELVGRTAPPTLRLDAEPTPRRLREAIISMLRRHRQPLLLLLEDLQWADSASLLLLNELIDALSSLPLLIVSTYRTEGAIARPLPFLASEQIALSRLDAAAQNSLVEAMLGTDGQASALQALLAHEAGGNPLFILSVLRELIDQAGSIAALRADALLTRRPAEGVTDALQRRLRRVLPAHRWLMQICALAGRTIDERIFRQLASTASIRDWEFWDAGSAIGVLERYDDTWRFAHDLMRELLAAELTAAESRDAHLAVADAIRAAYPSAQEYAAALALHLDRAEAPSEAAEAYLVAAEYALSRGGAADARTYGQRILKLLPANSEISLLQLQAERLIAQSFYAQGIYGECCTGIEQAERSLRACKQRAALAGQGTALRREEILLLRFSESFLLLGRPNDMGRRYLRALPRINQFEEPRAPGMLCLGIGYLVSSLGFHRAGLALCASAGWLHRRRGFTPGVPEVSRIRSLISMRNGQWESSQRAVDHVLRWADERGAATLRLHGLVAQSLSLLCQGKLPAALAAAARIGIEAKESRHDFFEILGRIAEARVHLRQGLLFEIQNHVDAASKNPLVRQSAHGWIAVQSLALRLAAERRDDAEVLAIAVELISATRNMVTALLNLFDFSELLTRTLLRCMVARVPTGERLRRAAVPSLLWECHQRARSLLRRTARRMPVARSGWLQAEAELAYYQHRPAAARCHATRALQVAERYRMPYEIACAHLLLAALNQGPSSTRADLSSTARALHQRSGEALLAKLGAVWLYPLPPAYL